MSKPRISYPGAIHHVYNRCNNREPLLKSGDLQTVLEILRTAKAKFRFKLFSFSLLNNHYHLLLQTGQHHSLSKAMQWFDWMCAFRLNQNYGRTGHLWQSRFQSPLVDTEAYLLRCALYIDLNPVQAGLVEQPRLWPFGSATRLLSGRPGGLSDPSPAYLALGRNPSERLKQYKRLLEETQQRNLALKKAIQGADREEALRWLTKQPEEPIPFRRELSRLLDGRLKRYLRLYQNGT